MKRDMDLIRDLLLAIEADNRLNGITHLEPEIGEFGVTESNFYEVAYHLTLLIEAGFIEGRRGMRMPIITRLTWAGHDFADSIRDPEVWAKTKKGAMAAGGFTVELLRDLAKGFIRKKVEEMTGVQL